MKQKALEGRNYDFLKKGRNKTSDLNSGLLSCDHPKMMAVDSRADMSKFRAIVLIAVDDSEPAEFAFNCKYTMLACDLVFLCNDVIRSFISCILCSHVLSAFRLK